MSDPERIGIVVALREEDAAVRAAIDALPEAQRVRVKLARGGMGWKAAEAAATQLAAVPGVRLLCSSGFSGALQDGLEAGSLVLAERVVALPPTTASFASNKIEKPVPVHENALAEAARALMAAGLAYRGGQLATAREPVLKSQDKRMLGLGLQAVAVDMECAAVAYAARNRSLGTFALRAISDTVNDDLPPEVATFLDENGQVKMGNVAKFAMKGPSNVGTLMKLKSNAEKASAALAAGWKAVLPALLELSLG
ncbi:MAG: hypothetical protein KIS92_02445 [Planctomycetota bacterium]|nr:hypothetical protein [Planctomycetota bacterium]